MASQSSWPLTWLRARAARCSSASLGQRLGRAVRPHLQHVLRVLQRLEEKHVGLERVAAILFEKPGDGVRRGRAWRGQGVRFRVEIAIMSRVVVHLRADWVQRPLDVAGRFCRLVVDLCPGPVLALCS